MALDIATGKDVWKTERDEQPSWPTPLIFEGPQRTELITAAPLFAIGGEQSDRWRMRLSRAATFQSLSMLAIAAYLAVMAVLVTALRDAGVDWTRALLIVLLALMTIGAIVLIPSSRARGWAKVKIAKHLFEHRYDYRTEWLRFTETIGAGGPKAPPLGQRVIKAFADILDAPGGLLFTDHGRHVTAEILHAEAVTGGERVSLATVYNTLHQFKRAGLVRELAIDGTRTYFDTNPSNHSHFYVEQDGRLMDIPEGSIRVDGLPTPPRGMRRMRPLGGLLPYVSPCSAM